MKTRALTLRKNAAFTLIELLIVVIIVGILAAAAVPMYLSQTNRARASEAAAGLGAIRSQQAVHFSEHGDYLAVTAGNIANDPTDAGAGLGLDFSNNKYFGNGCFSVTAPGDGTFTATADGRLSANSEVSTIVVTMDQTGTLTYDFSAAAAE